MRLGDNKIAHLAHVSYDALAKGRAFELLADDARVRRELKQAITRSLKAEEEIEDAVRRKIQSYSRNIIEGSPEWDVLFAKHYQEELKKRGRL